MFAAAEGNRGPLKLLVGVPRYRHAFSAGIGQTDLRWRSLLIARVSLVGADRGGQCQEGELVKREQHDGRVRKGRKRMKQLRCRENRRD